MRIKITKGGIFGAKGEIAVGTEIEVTKGQEDNVRKQWAGRFEEIGGSGATLIVAKENETETKKKLFDAKHKGAGVYAIYKVDGEGKTTDEIVRDKLTKAQAEEFDALDDAGQAKWFTDNPAEKPTA